MAAAGFTVIFLEMDATEMKSGPDVAFLERGHELVARQAGPVDIQPHHHQVMRMGEVVIRQRQRPEFVDARQQFTVTLAQCGPLAVHGFEPRQLADAQHRLHIGQIEFEARFDHLRLGRAAVGLAVIGIDAETMEFQAADPVGQITLAAALAQDTLGWMLLAMIAAVADGGVLDLGSVARTVLGTVAFGGLGLTIGRRLVAGLLEWVRLSARAEQGMLTASVVLMLLSAAATQWIGVHAVLGAFLMGMILRGLPELHERVVQPIEAVTMGVFAPIFFAAAGLNVSLAVLAQPRLLALTLGFTAVACLGKIVG